MWNICDWHLIYVLVFYINVFLNVLNKRQPKDMPIQGYEICIIFLYVPLMFQFNVFGASTILNYILHVYTWLGKMQRSQVLILDFSILFLWPHILFSTLNDKNHGN